MTLANVAASALGGLSCLSGVARANDGRPRRNASKPGEAPGINLMRAVALGYAQAEQAVKVMAILVWVAIVEGTRQVAALAVLQAAKAKKGVFSEKASDDHKALAKGAIDLANRVLGLHERTIWSHRQLDAAKVDFDHGEKRVGPKNERGFFRVKNFPVDRDTVDGIVERSGRFLFGVGTTQPTPGSGKRMVPFGAQFLSGLMKGHVREHLARCEDRWARLVLQHAAAVSVDERLGPFFEKPAENSTRDNVSEVFKYLEEAERDQNEVIHEAGKLKPVSGAELNEFGEGQREMIVAMLPASKREKKYSDEELLQLVCDNYTEKTGMPPPFLA